MTMELIAAALLGATAGVVLMIPFLNRQQDTIADTQDRLDAATQRIEWYEAVMQMPTGYAKVVASGEVVPNDIGMTRDERPATAEPFCHHDNTTTDSRGERWCLRCGGAV